MRVLGFMSILYGKEYLKESLLSVINHVDKMVIAYTYHPSHGVAVKIQCPDSRNEIYNICVEVLGEKLIWNEQITYRAENEHRAVARQYATGYDLILTIDADEVYESSELQTALDYAYNGKSRRYGMKGYLNFWRCFDYVCTDGFRPIRIENLNNHNNDQDLECPLTIYHFSTAQSEIITRYKYQAFGHASELRKNWLQDIFYKWTPAMPFDDVHCVAFGIWNPVRFDKSNLPDILKQHPNYNKELI